MCTHAYTNTLWLIKILENLAINRKRDNYLLWARAHTRTEKVWEKKMWKKREAEKIEQNRPEAITSLTHQLNYTQ